MSKSSSIYDFRSKRNIYLASEEGLKWRCGGSRAKTNKTEKKKREKSSAIRHVSLSPIVVVVVVANWLLLLLLLPPTFICSSETGTDLEAAEAPL